MCDGVRPRFEIARVGPGRRLSMWDAKSLVIMEGDTLAHVLYREQVESNRLAGKLDVMSLRLVAGHWLILLNDDVIWRFPLVGPK